jgi:hypothetical protein
MKNQTQPQTDKATAGEMVTGFVHAMIQGDKLDWSKHHTEILQGLGKLRRYEDEHAALCVCERTLELVEQEMGTRISGKAFDEFSEPLKEMIKSSLSQLAAVRK